MKELLVSYIIRRSTLYIWTMASYESWGDLYNRLYPEKHISELTPSELEFYYENILFNYNRMNKSAVRSQNIADVIISASILGDQDGMQVYHLRFLIRLLLWAFSTKEISTAKNYL